MEEIWVETERERVDKEKQDKPPFLVGIQQSIETWRRGSCTHFYRHTKTMSDKILLQRALLVVKWFVFQAGNKWLHGLHRFLL